MPVTLEEGQRPLNEIPRLSVRVIHQHMENVSSSYVRGKLKLLKREECFSSELSKISSELCVKEQKALLKLGHFQFALPILSATN